MSTKHTVLMLCVRQNGHKKALECRRCTKSNICAAKMFGCSRVIARSLVRRFEQTGISIDAHDQCNVSKQCQDKNINLHSHIDVSGSSWQL